MTDRDPRMADNQGTGTDTMIDADDQSLPSTGQTGPSEDEKAQHVGSGDAPDGSGEVAAPDQPHPTAAGRGDRQDGSAGSGPGASE